MPLRSENLIISESMAQNFGYTVVQGKQTHSRLRNCFSCVAVESKSKSGSGELLNSRSLVYNNQKNPLIAAAIRGFFMPEP